MKQNVHVPTNTRKPRKLACQCKLVVKNHFLAEFATNT